MVKTVMQIVQRPKAAENRWSGVKKETNYAYLLPRLNREIIAVCRKGIRAADALAAENEEEFMVLFDDYQRSLSDYLQLMDDQVYSKFEGAFDDAVQRRRFTQFEKRASLLYVRVVSFLARIKPNAMRHKMLVSRAIYKIDQLLIDQHRSERVYLYPMLNRAT